jgi:hypothetical protein
VYTRKYSLCWLNASCSKGLQVTVSRQTCALTDPPVCIRQKICTLCSKLEREGRRVGTNQCWNSFPHFSTSILKTGAIFISETSVASPTITHYDNSRKQHRPHVL